MQDFFKEIFIAAFIERWI